MSKEWRRKIPEGQGSRTHPGEEHGDPLTLGWRWAAYPELERERLTFSRAALRICVGMGGRQGPQGQ